MRPHTILPLLCISLLTTVHAEVSLAPIFTDHAVIQRGKTVPIWGKATAGERVTVSFADQKIATVATGAGHWRVDLAALPANPVGQTLTATGENTVSVHDVLIGDVWLCGGQSNMEWPVRRSRDAESEIAAANFPQIRHLKVERRIADQPITTMSGEWTVCSPDTVMHYTAVGYFFARRLQQDLEVPIGLINSNWGGTPVEAWLPPSASDDPELAVAIASHQVAISQGILHGNKAYRDNMDAWRAARDAASSAGQSFAQEPPKKPWQPGPFKTATVLYNGMIEPLLPYGLAGCIWYQGEGNGGQPETYHAMFRALIETWREKFEQPDLPFYWAQLASWDAGNGDSTDWALLREAQQQTLALPHTGQAILMDIGEAFDIHPKNKQDVGDRLARIALANHYGRDVAHRGPVHQNTSYRDNIVSVAFDHAEGLTTRDGKAPRGFEIAGTDGEFHAATATIKGHVIHLSSPAVATPRDVRYAWRRWVDANLQNETGLPAEPFRTDRD